MLWPSPSEYAQAVGYFPNVSVLDLKLKSGKPKRGPNNTLLVYSGGFSTVFPIEVASNTYALRCWIKDVGDAKNRYEKIGVYLKQVGLHYFTDFEYVPEGILINGKKYPITRMEWAEGETLRDFIGKNFADTNIFKTVANEFRQMFETLHTHQISHGDLQDGNILLRRNGSSVEIKLIDYDSLYVPSLHGQSSPTRGFPEYQHPARGALSDEKMDYFSELVIYLSFLSLSEKPELWNQFKDKTERGLLFSKEDFENPNQSTVFQELANLSPDVQQLAATLKDFCAKTSIDQLAPLEAVLPKPDAKTYSDQGFAHLNKKQYSEAIAEFQKAIAINSNYKTAHYGLGLAYLHSKRHNEAINAFERAIKSDASYKEAHHCLGLAYFGLGDNSKATAAANAALTIDSHYQPAHQLLDAISPPSPTKPTSTSTSTSSTSHSASSHSVPSNPWTNFWQPVPVALRNLWQFIIPGTLGLALVICFIAFLPQMNSKDEALSQNTVLKNQLAEKETEIQSLTTSVENLEGRNEELNRENGRLQDDLGNLIPAANATSRAVVNLQKQLSAKESALALWVDENQNLRRQLTKSATEIRQLRSEKTDARNENRNLQGKNEGLLRQNQKLRNENKALQNQLDNAKQSGSNPVAKLPSRLGNNRSAGVVLPELPRQVDAYKDIATLASVNYNNNGIKAFRRKDYRTAVIHFEQAIQADLKVAITHYNLGCTYLEMKKYREAARAFNKAIAYKSRFKEAYYNRSLAYFKMSAFQSARQDIRTALRIDKSYQRAHNFLTAIEHAQREPIISQ